MFGQEPGGVIAVGDAELAAGTVAIGVDRGLGHPQFAGDLLGAEVAIDEAQAFPLSRRQQFDLLVHDARPPASLVHAMLAPASIRSRHPYSRSRGSLTG